MKYQKILAVSMAALLSLSLAGCSTSSSSTSSSNSSSSVATIKAMKGEDLAKIQADDKEKEKYLVIDVREAKEYNEGHLKHATNIPLADFEKSLDKISAWKEKPVIVYCNTGKKSGEAADILVKNGFKDVTNADGVKTYTSYQLVKYTGLLGVDFQKAITENKGAFFDGRDAKDFEKSHVKDAKNFDAKKLDDLAAMLPADKEAPVYFYCYSGNRSSKGAEKAIELGYKNVFNAIDGTKEFEYKF